MHSKRNPGIEPARHSPTHAGAAAGVAAADAAGSAGAAAGVVAMLRGTRRVLDGGLATHLESLGAELGGLLWSGRLLRDDPALIQRAHADYFAAGADVCITASYQCSVPNLCSALGVDEPAAERLISESVAIARAAIPPATAGRPPPLVAGSVGPYGACRNDGSEYTGDYHDSLTPEELGAWHARRVDLLLAAGVDLLAFETIPCRAEAVGLLALLRDRPAARAWLSLCCRDDARLSSGEAVDEVVRDVERSDAAGQIEALGVNCTKPRYVSALVRRIRALTERPIVVYPNAGESFDAATGRWVDDAEAPPERFAALAEEWFAAGATAIGGCCRTGPAHIAAVRRGVDATT